MNRLAKIGIIVFAILLCVGAAVFSNSSYLQSGRANRDLDAADFRTNYRYVVSDAPLKLSLNQIESILRHDPKTKDLFALGKMDFGSVTVRNGAVVAEIEFRASFVTEEFVCVLSHKADRWYVARVWPPGQPLRNLRT